MDTRNKIIDIIGVQADLGASCRGADVGPKAFRCAQLLQTIKALGYSVCDCGDISLNADSTTTSMCSDPRLNNIDEVNKINSMLYQRVCDTLSQGHFPLVIGGDHSIAAGSVSAVKKHFGSIGLIWVDAHGDFNSAESSPSGNIHGTPLSALTGNGPDIILPFKEKSVGYVDAKNTVLVGARALDDEEKNRLKMAGITVFGMDEIDRRGIDAVMEDAVKILLDNTAGIYLSFDIDSVDPSIATGVGTPVKGGLTYREAHYLCEYLSKTAKLIGFEMVELNPILDNQNQTAELAVELISSLLGKTII